MIKFAKLSIHFNNAMNTIGNAVCAEGTFTLYENYTKAYDNASVVGGTPLRCIAGQYATLCNDNTTDPASAYVLCTELGYYGQLVNMYFSSLCLYEKLFLSL